MNRGEPLHPADAVAVEARLVVVEQLAKYAAEWDRLVGLAELASPFLRSWWLGAVAETSPRFALAVRDDRLLGGLALQVDTIAGVERVRLLGDGPLCSDHLDVVSAPGEHAAVAALLSGWLGRPGSRMVDFAGVATPNRVGALLPGRVREEVLGTAAWVDLRIDHDDYLAGRPARLRNSLRRSQRRLDRLGARARHHRDAAAGIGVLEQLHHARWGAASGLLPRFDRFAAAAVAGAERGEVVFHELWVGDRAVACEITLEVAGRSSFYQSGRLVEPRFSGAGTVLKAAVLDDSRARGLREYDLLRGDEAYKNDWSTGERAVLRLQATTGVRARAVDRASLVTRTVCRAGARIRNRHEAARS